MTLRKGSLVASSLVFIFSINLFAQEVYTIQNKTLKEALEIISKKSNLSYIANDKLLEKKTINNIKNVEGLRKALNQLLKNTGLKAVIEKKAIVILEEESKINKSIDLAPIEVISTLNNVSEGNDSYNIDSMNTATRLNLSEKETPQSISVVTRKKMDDLGLSNIEEALKTVTGINVVSSAGSYRFQSRAFYVDQIQEDGVSSTTDGAMYNQFRTDNPTSDLYIYDHIEVVRGSTGLSQGNGEPGGTVNLIRKKPTKQLQSNANISVGSWNKRRITADISASINEDKTIRARLISIYDKADSFKDIVENETKEVYGVMDFDLNDYTTVSLGMDYMKKEGVPDIYGLPLAQGGGDLNLSTDTFLGANWNSYDIEKKNLLFELDHSFNDNWQLESKINYRKVDSSMAFAGLIANLGNPVGLQSDNLVRVNNIQNYENESDVKSIQADLTGIYDLFGQSHEFFTGFIFSKEDYQSRWKRVLNSQTYNLYTFNGNISEPNWSDTSSLFNDSLYKYTFYQTAFNIASRFNFTDQLHLLLGTRYSHFKTDGYNFDYKWGGSTNQMYPETKIDKYRFVPYAGLTYDIDPFSSIYLSYTSIFKPTVRKDSSGKLLDPVIGDNYEVGIKSSFLEDRLNTSFALFKIKQKNRAVSVSGTNYYEPVGRVESKGFEAQISGKINSRLNISAGYTFNISKYLDTESTSNSAGTNFSEHTPKHIFRMYTNYLLPINENRWSIGLGVNAQSKTNSLYDAKQSGMSIWNSSLNYKIDKNMNLRLNVNNMFDKRYFLTNKTRDSDFNNFYGNPRNVLLTLSWKL